MEFRPVPVQISLSLCHPYSFRGKNNYVPNPAHIVLVVWKLRFPVPSSKRFPHEIVFYQYEYECFPFPNP